MHSWEQFRHTVSSVLYALQRVILAYSVKCAVCIAEISFGIHWYCVKCAVCIAESSFGIQCQLCSMHCRVVLAYSVKWTVCIAESSFGIQCQLCSMHCRGKFWHTVSTVQYALWRVVLAYSVNCAVCIAESSFGIQCQVCSMHQHTVSTVQYALQRVVWHTVSTVQYASAYSVNCAVCIAEGTFGVHCQLCSMHCRGYFWRTLSTVQYALQRGGQSTQTEQHPQFKSDRWDGSSIVTWGGPLPAPLSTSYRNGYSTIRGKCWWPPFSSTKQQVCVCVHV